MLKGEEAFDLAKAKTGLETIAKNAKSGAALYPADSKTGDTKALLQLAEFIARLCAQAGVEI